jgi:hypothetical protein
MGRRKQMTEAEEIADAQAHARRAERDAIAAQVRLDIINARIAAHETAEARRQRILIQAAVDRMVKSGTIHPADHFGQFRMTEQFIKNPSLIPLALTPTVIRARRPAVNQKTNTPR